MRGQVLGVWTLIGFTIIFISFALLLPMYQGFANDLCPLFDSVGCFFLNAVPWIILLSGIAAIVMFAGNWSRGGT